MQKAELIGAFRTGVQTGHNIEGIKQSLINAGYSIQDVEDSANAFSQGKFTPSGKPLPQIQLPTEEAKPEEKPIEKGLEKMPLYFWIALISSVVIVLSLIGYIVYRLIG